MSKLKIAFKNKITAPATFAIVHRARRAYHPDRFQNITKNKHKVLRETIKFKKQNQHKVSFDIKIAYSKGANGPLF